MATNLALYGGFYRRYRTLHWDEIRRVVFICKGNICRSAYADAAARRIGLNAASFGIEARDGQPANDTAIRIAAARDVDLTPHRTRRLTADHLRPGDLLLCMEPVQARAVMPLVEPSHQVSLLGLWASAPRAYIADPYELDESYWKTCLQTIDDALSVISDLAVTARLRNAPS